MDLLTPNDVAASEILQRSAATTAIPSPNTAPAAPSVTTEDEFLAKQAREKAHTWVDYAASTVRQDSPIPGLVSSLFGPEHAPVPGYSSISSPDSWKTLTEGISPEYQNEFLDATSPAHAEMIRQRLLEKQNDLQTLGDMGTVGNIGRFAYGITEPTALMAGLASGGVGFGVKAGMIAKTLGGMATAGVTMAGVEKLRQSVNFENDSSRVLEAGLLAATLTGPFAYAGARMSTRLATAARKEGEALELLRKQHEGAALAPEEIATLHEVQKAADTSAAVENGTAHADDMERIWSTHENLQSAARAKQLDDIHSEGLLNKGTEMKAVTSVLDQVNAADAPVPTAMEAAFQKALGLSVAKKAAQAETPLHLQANEKAPLAELQGDNVFWHSDEGSGIDHGTVMGETPKGQLIVQHADTGERVLLDRGDLHPNSPGHHFEFSKEAVTGEPAYSPFLDAMSAPESYRVTTERAGGYAELPPKAAQQSLSTAAPEGSQPFLGGSAGAAQVGHVSVPDSKFLGHIPMLDKLGIKIPIRYDLFAQLNRSENPILKKWATRLIKDPVGSVDGFTQGRTAEEEKGMLSKRWNSQTMLAASDAFDKVREIRKLGPLEAHKFSREFHEMVSNVVTGDVRLLQANPDIAGELRKAAASYRQMYQEVIDMAKKVGVKGADAVAPDDFYINRVWNHEAIKNAMRLHGEDNVAGVLAHSFNNSQVYGDMLKAKAFLRAILKTEFSTHLSDVHLASRDMATLRNELGAIDPATGSPKLSENEINAIVDVMFEAKAGAGGDAGNASNLKFRMDLDEAYTQKLPTGEMKISDMFERDARVLAQRYTNSMAGHIAMAKRGIKSRADAEAFIFKSATDHHMENGLLTPDGGKFAKDLQWMRDIYDNIVGRPMSTQVFNNTSRLSSAVRAWSRSAYLGELGLTAAGEMKQTIALTSMRAVMQQSGSFANLIRALRSGRIADSKLAREVEQFWAFGLEHKAAYARQNEVTEFTYDRTLSKLENAANKASHAVDSFSGNSSITSATRQMSAMAFIQHHFDMAVGHTELTPAKIKRLAAQGIEDSDIHQVLGDLKKYATADATNGRVETVDWESWHRDSPDTYEQYHLAVERETRDAIQDHSLGETIPWGHTQIGKIFMELRTFMAVAHAKNFLKNMSYMDRTSANILIYSMVGESLMYSIQTSINFAHNPKELERRLSLGNIAANAFQRSSTLGFLPAAMSTGYWAGSGGRDFAGDVFGASHAGSANTDNRNLMTPPAAALLGKAYNTVKTVGGMLNPLSGTLTTKREVKDAFSVLPFGNFYGMRNLSDYVSDSFPKQEARQITP